MARGNVKEMEEGIMQTKKLQEIIENHTIENTAITREKLEKIYKRKQDWYITPEEALELDIIDGILGFPESYKQPDQEPKQEKKKKKKGKKKHECDATT
jgi:ATP-dependent protease ClpP protease subunit